MLKYSTNRFFKLLIWVVFGMIFIQKGNAQSLRMDFNYLQKRDSLIESKTTEIKQKISRTNHPIFFILNGSLRMYQKIISPQFSANCLYELSCSRFSQLSIQEYGAIKGLALTADRLARCNRISATTINPFRINQQGKVIDSPSMYKLKE